MNSKFNMRTVVYFMIMSKLGMDLDQVWKAEKK